MQSTGSAFPLTPLKLLMVEDCENDYELMRHALKRAGIGFGSLRVERPDALHQALACRRWDAIISDLVLPGFYGLDALRMVRASDSNCPFLLFSASLGNWGPTAMRLGADGYLEKQKIAELAPALLMAIEKKQMAHDAMDAVCV